MVAPLTANESIRKPKSRSERMVAPLVLPTSCLDQRVKLGRDRHGFERTHPCTPAIACREAARKRTQWHEQQPHRLAGGFPPISQLDGVLEHVPVGCEMGPCKGLAQNMFPLECLPGTLLVTDSARFAKSSVLIADQGGDQRLVRWFPRRICCHDAPRFFMGVLLHPVVDTGSRPDVPTRITARRLTISPGARLEIRQHPRACL